MRRWASEPPAGRDDQSKVSPPLARPPGPGAARAVLTGPADGILPLLRGQCSAARSRWVRPPAARTVRACRRPTSASRSRRTTTPPPRGWRRRSASRTWSPRCWCGAGFARPGGARARSSPPAARHPLDAFGGLRDGAAQILAHVERGARITVHGDYDVDGVCSTAVLVRALRTLGADVDWYLPSRIDDGYGLALATVERLAARGTRAARHGRLRDHGGREVAAARAAGTRRRGHGPPRAARGRPAAGRADRAPGASAATRARSCARPASRTCWRGALLEAAGMDAGGRGRRPRPRRARHGGRLRAAGGREPAAGARGPARARVDAQAGAAGADGGRARGPERGRRRRDRLPARAADQRGGPAAPRRRGARAAADVRRRARARDRRRARRASTSSGATSRRGSCSRPRRRSPASAGGGAARAYVLAADGWHPGVIGIVASRIAERHHRPAVLIALDGDEGTGSGRSIPAFDLLGGLDARAAPSCCATAATARPRG